jgi:hypothetical protein
MYSVDFIVDDVQGSHNHGFSKFLIFNSEAEAILNIKQFITDYMFDDYQIKKNNYNETEIYCSDFTYYACVIFNNTKINFG